MHMLLLFAFRDLLKEWDDSNFFQAAGVVGHFKCAFYTILSTTVGP